MSNPLAPILFAIYFIFGFLLQRGSYCGAALISSVVLHKEYRGVTAIAFTILISMFGFAVLSEFGWITLNPHKLEILPAVVGGSLFGVGMVLSGGCISGSLFKATELRLTSILAVIGIFAGIILTGIGPGARFRRMLSDATANFNYGPSLADLTGISYTVLASLIALIGIILLAIVLRNQKKADKINLKPQKIKLTDFITQGWPVVTVGIIIGLLNWPAYITAQHLGHPYGLMATLIPASVLQLVVLKKLEIVGLIAWSLVGGSALSAWLNGNMVLRSADRITLFIAFVGGILVGSGAVIGWGCFVGNGLTGWALLSINSIIFGITMVFANWITTIFYLRGW